MALSDPLHIPIDALRTHARSVERVAAAVDTSHTATTYLDRGAYGVMCQFMPEYFEPGMRDTVDGLASSVQELHALAAALRTAANTYESADAHAADRVNNTATVRLAL